MDDIISFGHWMKLRRIALYLTQGDLGQLAGCSAIAIRKIEADERRPSPELAEKLAQQLDLDGADRQWFLRAARAELSSTRLPTPFADRAHARRLSRLPTPPIPLIGREPTVALVCDQLHKRDVRHVTLTGPGGVGKTRVALEAAARLSEAFTAGACFIALAPIGDPALVGPTIAYTLGIKEAGSDALLDRLKAYLSVRALLLVLDNFEHLAPAVPLVAELLACAPRLKVLATSRAPLHLSGEHLIVVPPLPTLDGVRLFVARAQAARADFVLARDDAPAVIEICRRLDGLPLAIELAAARSRLFTPRALLARLSNADATAALALLTEGPSDHPSRQQTLRQMIAWSCNLLSAADQRAFARLGIFAGGFTIAAATAVVGSAEPDADDQAHVTGVDKAEPQTLALLSALLDQSLLQCSAPDGGEPRFTMLETTRAYALECLAAGGELEMLRRRHARYFLQCAEIAHRQENTGTQPYWLRWILSEHANLSAALAWSIEADPSIGLALVAALYGLWFTSGQFAAAQMWLARALTQRAKAPSQLQAQVLLGAGLLAMPQGAFAHMEAACAEALTLFRATDDQRGCAEALLYLSIAAYGCGDAEQARTLTHQGLELARRIADLSLIAIGELFLADRASWIGECEQAERHYQASLAISRQLGDPWVIGLNQLGFGRIARTRGQYQQAQRILEEALAILRSVPAPMWIAQTLHELGRLGQQTGDIRRAIAYQQESLTLTYETGGMVDVPACLERLAAALVALPDLERGICLLGAAAALRANFDPPQVVGDAQIYVDVQAAARDHLGEQVAADAWDMGRALAIDAAIALALAPVPG